MEIMIYDFIITSFFVASIIILLEYGVLPLYGLFKKAHDYFLKIGKDYFKD